MHFFALVPFAPLTLAGLWIDCRENGGLEASFENHRTIFYAPNGRPAVMTIG